VEIYQKLKKLIKSRNLSVAVGDEGGFSPAVDSNDLAIGLLIEAIQKAGFSYSQEVSIGLDMASNSYYKEGRYAGLYTTTNSVAPENYLSEVKMMKNEYDLILLEDPLHEDDWESWCKLTREIGKNTLIVGDDLLVTNIGRLEKAIEVKACNSILIKPNQIGTLTETLEVIRKAKKANFKIVVSHRSGETNDDFVADLAVAVGADFVKFGAPARGERVAKYNRLLQIYQILSSRT
jgi:enolase